MKTIVDDIIKYIINYMHDIKCNIKTQFVIFDGNVIANGLLM